MGINIRTCLLQLVVIVACVLVAQTTADPFTLVGQIGMQGLSATSGSIRGMRGASQRSIGNPTGYSRFLKWTGSKGSFTSRFRNKPGSVTVNDGRGTSSVQGKQQTGSTVQGQQSSTPLNGRSSGNGDSLISKGFRFVTRWVGGAVSTMLTVAWAALTVMLAVVTKIFPRTVEAIKQGQTRIRDRLVVEMQSGRRSTWRVLDVRTWYYTIKGVILSIIIGLLDALNFALGKLLLFIVVFILLVVFLVIQNQASELVTMAHSSTLLAQKTTNKVMGLSNTAADVTEVALPMINAQIYSSVQSTAMLVAVFVPQDAYLDAMSDTSGEEEDRLDSQMAYDGELRGRRLQVQVDSDGKVQAWNLKKFIKPFGLYALRMSNVMVLISMFSAVISAIILQMTEPFLDVILYLLSMIVMKFVCLVGHGRILCTILEILELSMFFFVRIVFFLLAIFFAPIFALIGGSDIPLPDIPLSCGESDFGNQAETLAPICGGFLWEADPIGASLSGLRQTRINLARAEENRKQEEARKQFNRFQSVPGSTYHGTAGMTGNGGIGGGGRRLQEMWDSLERGDWLYCTRSTHDGSFVETMRGRRLHVTHGKELGCPHARDVILNPLHERAMQFHRLNVKDACLNVCLNGFRFTSCYEASGEYQPLLAMGGGGCDGGDMEANRTAVDAILHEMFPELTQQQRNELILSEPPPQPPPPPPPAADDTDTDENSSNTTTTTTTTAGRRNLFGTLSRKIWSKSEMVQHLEREYVGKYVVADMECNVEPRKPNKSPHETFIDMMCIIGKYAETQDWSQILQGSGLDKSRLGHLNRPTEFSLKGIPQAGRQMGAPGGRRLMEEDDTGPIRLFQQATEFVKLTEGLRREDRLLRAAEAMKNDTFTRRVLTTVTEKPSFVHVYRHGFGQTLKALDRLLERSEVANGEDGRGSGRGGGGGGRRRRLAEEDGEATVTTSFQIISSCPLNYYLCANGRQCVPNNAIDECLPLEVTEETGVLAQANQYIQDAATYELDIKGYVRENCYECWRDYDRRPETNPFQYSADADLSNVKYCCGLVEPDLSRFDPVAETGISGFVAGICNSTSSENGTALASNCFCPWYFPTSLSNNVYVYGLFDLYVYNHIMNALVIVQTFVSVYITGPTGIASYIGYVWTAWAEFYCAGHCSPWFTDLFGTFGYETTTTRRLTCVFLHAGSFFYTTFLCFGLAFFFFLFIPTLTFLSEVFLLMWPRAKLRPIRRRGSPFT